MTPRFHLGASLLVAIPLHVGFLLSNSTVSQADETGAAVPAEHLDFFEAKVRPLLIEHCYECHSNEAGEASGDFLIDSSAGIQRGGAHGTALIAGKPNESLIIRAVNYDDPDLAMPPEGKLDDDAIETLRRWIALGAPDPRSDSLAQTQSPLDRDPRSHWAFIPPKRSVAPNLSSQLSRDPLDAHAEQRATDAGLSINAEAKREVLIRRLYHDLTGLPPKVEAVDRFVRSDRPTDYLRLVDQLLATPQFGERFGRHWLDVARYADTVGYALAGKERRYKGSDRYRDWTIQSFATDMPYDDMLRHQLAADRTDPQNDAGNLDAMGFLTLGRKFLNPLDVIDDQIDVITRGIMGMTVTCARCHDHKFDPIPSSDYYSLGGIIFSSERPKEGVSPLMLVDKKHPIDSPVLIRGQLGNHGPIALRQFLTALRKPDEPRFTDGSGRWELAQRITAADNPLTARVMVNRIWAHLIGKPLVDTPSDFGFRTEPPMVPEVLDDLSADFSQHWSVKRLVRRIVLSRIYRQSVATSQESIRKDPDNRLLARGNRKRRDFESLRDSMLHAAGTLDFAMGGEPVEITLETLTPRRTIYAMIDRQNLPALFRTFDFASPDAHAPKRYLTTVPQQALYLLNNRQMFELARRAARRARTQASSDRPEELASVIFAAVLSRPPNADELRAASQFLMQPVHDLDATLDASAMWSYGTASIDDDYRPSNFKPLPIFKNGLWQSAVKMPADSPLGYAQLGKESGHTPRDVGMAVVRRFTAPFDGKVRLRGQMGHRNDQGDGVQASIWIGGKRSFSSNQKKNNRPYGPLSGSVKADQTIDLVAAPGKSDSFDSFFWRASIRLTADDGASLKRNQLGTLPALVTKTRRSLSIAWNS